MGVYMTYVDNKQKKKNSFGSSKKTRPVAPGT